ncbi:MAG: hypothetical protein GX348_10440 [Veillonellaceae bacterium]|nr:hypothetical protein [Veillonellaceae bacterium]
MNINKNRLSVVLAAIILTLIILGGGQFLWQRYAVDKPLAKVLNNINGIDSFYVDSNNKISGTAKLHISLTNVKNLQKTYQTVYEGAAAILGDNQFSVVIKDNRTPELEQVYYNVHLFVQEGIATGNFASMAEQIVQKAAVNGVEAQVYVDSVNVYLGLKKADADMYIVVPRQAGQPEVK